MLLENCLLWPVLCKKGKESLRSANLIGKDFEMWLAIRSAIAVSKRPWSSSQCRKLVLNKGETYFAAALQKTMVYPCTAIVFVQFYLWVKYGMFQQ